MICFRVEVVSVIVIAPPSERHRARERLVGIRPQDDAAIHEVNAVLAVPSAVLGVDQRPPDATSFDAVDDPRKALWPAVM